MRRTTSTSTSLPPSPSSVNQVWSLFWGIIHLLCVQPTACSQSDLTNPNPIPACVDTYEHKYMSCPLFPIISKLLASKKISTDHNATSLWGRWLIFFYGGVLRKSWGVSLLKERNCSVVWWYGCGYFGIFWQMAAGWTGPWVLSYLLDDTNIQTCKNIHHVHCLSNVVAFGY